MRRGILHRLKVFEILRNRFIHSQLQLRGETQVQYRRGQIRGRRNHGTVSLNAGGSELGCHGHRSFLRLCLRLGLRDKLLPITSFFEAGVYGADLGALLDDERRTALRAGFGDGHVGRCEIAIRVTRAAVEHSWAATAALAGAATTHEFAFVAFRTFNTHGDRARVLALRVAGAADEFAEAAAFLHEILAAKCTQFSERLIGLVRDARALDEAAGGLAVRVTGASEEGAEAPPLDGHLLAAIVAILGFGFAAGFLGKFRGEVLNEIALGIARTAEEEPVAADAFEQFALSALFTLLPGRDAGFVGKHLVAGLVEVNDEFFPELFDGFAPRQLAFLDFVKFLFEPRGKRDVENVFETLYQQHADALAEHGGRETPLVLGDVFALDDR